MCELKSERTCFVKRFYLLPSWRASSMASHHVEYLEKTVGRWLTVRFSEECMYLQTHRCKRMHFYCRIHKDPWVNFPNVYSVKTYILNYVINLPSKLLVIFSYLKYIYTQMRIYTQTWNSWHQPPPHQAHVSNWEIPSCLIHHWRHHTSPLWLSQSQSSSPWQLINSSYSYQLLVRCSPSRWG